MQASLLQPAAAEALGMRTESDSQTPSATSGRQVTAPDALDGGGAGQPQEHLGPHAPPRLISPSRGNMVKLATAGGGGLTCEQQIEMDAIA